MRSVSCAGVGRVVCVSHSQTRASLAMRRSSARMGRNECRDTSIISLGGCLSCVSMTNRSGMLTAYQRTWHLARYSSPHRRKEQQVESHERRDEARPEAVIWPSVWDDPEEKKV